MGFSCNLAAGVVLSVALCSGAGAETPPFIAGLHPSERPANAPVIAEQVPDGTRTAWAARGLGEPLTGVGFLKDQGPWYTPFDRPNMMGRYDLRGLHQAQRKE